MWSVKTRPNFRSPSGGWLLGVVVRSNVILAAMPPIMLPSPRGGQGRSLMACAVGGRRSLGDGGLGLLASVSLAVADPPDRVGAVVADQQRAVTGHRHPD